MGDGEAALGALAARHGHRIVIEQFIGNAGAHGQGATDGQGPGVVIRAVAQIHEHMLFAGERRGARPGQPLAPHMAGEIGIGVSKTRHVVAADPRQSPGALGQTGRGVVRTA